tara:strand:+ start:565 stop:993 length:429 start_codon:yes stop_codon:yes gene_type:complete
MLQRIQTVYILIGVLVICGITCFVPHTICDIPEANIYLFNSYAGVIWLILLCINSLISILQFRNRRKQLSYVNGNLIGIVLLLLTLCIFDYFNMTRKFISNQIDSHNWMFYIGFVVAFLFFLLAKKSIKKDEELINSINRLR